MERFGLIGLLAVVVTSLAAAQRVEVAFLAGAYLPLPSQRSGLTGLICDAPPCPTHYDETLHAGKSFGGQFSIQFGPRFGIEATVQHSTAVGSRRTIDPFAGPSTVVLGSSPREFAATFVSLQPHLRSSLAGPVDMSFAAGPAVTSALGSSRTTLALALSGSIRARFTRAAVLQVRVSDTHLVGAVRNADRNYFTVHCGLGWVLNP